MCVCVPLTGKYSLLRNLKEILKLICRHCLTRRSLLLDTDRHTQRHTDRYADTHRDTQTDTLTDIQTDTQRHTDTSWLVFMARLRSQFRTPPVRNAPKLRSLHAAGSIRICRQALQQCLCQNRHRGKLQNVSPPSVLFESSRIFLQYTGDIDAKK